MKRILMTLAAALVALPGPALAQSWWSDDWGYRQPVAIDTSAAKGVQETLTNAPVLVRLHAGLVDFTRLNEDGSDLRFATQDGTPLDFHLERFDRKAELALAWVKLPSVAAGAQQRIYVYYGNAKANGVKKPSDSFDGEQALVIHFAGGRPQDTTANANSIGNFTGQMVPEGLAAGGARLNAAGQLQVASSQSLTIAPGGRMTVSAWIKPAGEALPDSAIYTKYGAGGAGGAERLMIGLRGGVPYVRVIDAQGKSQEAAATAPIAGGSWAYVAVTAGDTVKLYVNGAQVAELAAKLPALAGVEMIGANDVLPAFTGDIDEIGRANVDRSASYLAFAAQSQGRDARVVTVDATVEEAGEGGHNYIAVLFSALTVDAWVVIIILSVMGLLSWLVMVSKGMFLSRIERANRQFLAFYKEQIATRGAHEGLGSTDASRWAENSTLARLLAIGQEETNQRVAEQSRGGGRFALAPQSVAAIRSALDAGMAREGQRLNARMVLLTIAISGGPFLGLLGTVIGVMITFAAVAAAGDVNINAIAPGIAAALLATVAGLAVAIPALFGYNYLLARVERTETENQIFVDELEKRLAETYRPDAMAYAA